MSTGTTRLLTADEFFDWANRPENRDRCFELERGEIVAMSRPGERHGLVCGNAVYLLNGYVRQRGKGFVCSNDTGIIVERDPDTVRGPDVALFDEVLRFDQLHLKFTDRIPRLAVEVLSPEDRFNKVLRRIAELLRRGVPLVWLVDPEDRTVGVHRTGELPHLYDEHEELTGNDVLPDLRIRVAEFFFMPNER